MFLVQVHSVLVKHLEYHYDYASTFVKDGAIRLEIFKFLLALRC